MNAPRIWPTTPLQRGLLASPIPYVGTTHIAVDGRVDESALRLAITAIHDLYPQLSAGFLVSADVEPTQFVTDTDPLVEVVALAPTITDAHLAAAANDAAIRAAERGFDLTDPPLIRWVWLPAGGRGRLVLVAHHAVLDAWSVPLIVAELARLLSHNPGAAPLTCSYEQHLASLGTHDADAAASHWRNVYDHLQESATPRWLEPAKDESRSLDSRALTDDTGGSGGSGGSTAAADADATAASGTDSDGQPTTVRSTLSGADTQRLGRAAHDLGVTVADALRGCVSIALDWLSGSIGTPFVTPIHGRDPLLPGSESTPGLFTDSVLVAHRSTPGTLNATVAHLAGAWRADTAHHRGGLSGTLRALGIADPALVIYAHEARSSTQDWRFTTSTGDAATLTLLDVDDVTHYPVEITTALGADADADGQDVLVIQVTTKPSIQAIAADRLLHALTTLVQQFITAGDVPLSAIDLRLRRDRDRERDQDRDRAEPDISHLAIQNAPAPDGRRAPALPLLPDLIDRALREHPQQYALTTDTARFSGPELARAVIARCEELLSLAQERTALARPIVALQLPRTAETIITLLAVVRAGFTCLVLDGSAPAARLAELITDLSIDLVIDAHGTRRTSAVRLSGGSPQGSTGRASDVRPDAGRRSEEQSITPLAVTPDDVAFIVLTSGSTGRPKPVAVPHGAMASLLHHHRTALWDDRVRVLAHTNSLHFDAHWDTLLGLFDGRRVHLMGAETLLDPHALAESLRTNEIDYLDMGPALWRSHLAAGFLTTLPSVCVAGGEAFPPDLWTQMRAVAATQGGRAGVPTPRVLNAYGPTEATVDALIADTADSETPRVGTAITGTLAHILDDWLRPVAPGTDGELYLAGRQLAHGYLGRSALTAERFVAAPGGARLYRTGDRAWMDESGSIALLGRNDDQISLNGFRIEPGEVAAALSALPGIAESHVAALPHPQGGKRLVGWVVEETHPVEPAASTSTSTSANGSDAADGLESDGSAGTDQSERLRAALAETLQRHMIPTIITVVPRFSVTSNGKLDVRALPVPDWARTGPTAATATTTTQRDVVTSRSTPNDGRSVAARSAPGTASALNAASARNTASAPNTAASDAIFEAVRHVLGTADADASLLQLGGDSISALRVSAALRRAGWVLAPADLLGRVPIGLLSATAVVPAAADADTAAPTPESQSDSIARGTAPATNDDESASLALDVLDPVYDVLPSGSLVESKTPLAGSSTGIYVASLRSGDTDPYRTVTLFEIEGVPHPMADSLIAAWDAVAMAHPVLRSVAVQGSDAAPSALVIDRPLTTHHVRDERATPHDAESTQRLRERALAQALHEQRLVDGRLSVAVWILTRDESGRDRVELALGLHHLIADGWSTPILAAELAIALAGGRPTREDGWFSYLNWVSSTPRTEWESEWRTRFDDPSTRTILADHLRRLPLDQSAPEHGTRLARWQLTARLNERILAACMERSVTLATVVQAAWARTLAARTGRSTVVFGLTSAGRELPLDSVEDALGAFLTTRPVRITVSPETGELCDAIRAETAATEYAAHLGPARITSAIGTRYDSLVVVEMNPRAHAESERDDRDSAAAHAGVTGSSEHAPVRVIPVRGEDSSGFPITLTLTHAANGPEVEIEIADRAIDPVETGDLLERFAAELLDALDIGDEAVLIHSVSSNAALVAEEPQSRGRRRRDEESLPAGVERSAELSGSVGDTTHPDTATADVGAGASSREYVAEVQELMAQVLGTESVGAHDDFFSRGGDSILVMTLAGSLRRAGFAADVRSIFELKTAAAIAGSLSRVQTQSDALQRHGTHEHSDAPIPLTPALRWYRDHVGTTADHMIQIRSVRVPPELSDARVSDLLAQVVRRHEGLRLRFTPDAITVVDSAEIDSSTLLHTHDGTDVLEQVRAAARRLDPARGRLVSAVRTSADVLHIIIHHLGIDAVSWQIVLADLADLDAGRTLAPAESFRSAAAALHQASLDRAGASRGARHLLGAVDVAERGNHDTNADTLPTQTASPEDDLVSVRDARHGTLTIDEHTTALLQAIVDDAHPMDFLLATAMTLALERPVTVEFEGHGRPLGSTGDARDDVRFTDVVGWFTQTWAVTLPAPSRSRLTPGDVSPPPLSKELSAQSERPPRATQSPSVRQNDDDLRHLEACSRRFTSIRPLADLVALDSDEAPEPASTADALDLDLSSDIVQRRPEVLVNYLGTEGTASERSADWDVCGDAASLEDQVSLSGTLRASHAWELNAGIASGRMTISVQCARMTLTESEHDDVIERLTESISRVARAAARLLDERSAKHPTTPIRDYVGVNADALGALPADGVDAVWPLSRAQAGIALESIHDPHGHYVARTDLELRGPLDHDAIRQAASLLAESHPALRMRLARVENRNVLVSAPSAAADLRILPSAAAVDAWAAEPFMIERGPLCRRAVVSTTPESHTISCIDHHLVLDGWSVPIVIDELFAAYRTVLSRQSHGESIQPDRSHRTGDDSFVTHVLEQHGRDTSDSTAAWATALPPAEGEVFGSASGPHDSIEATADLDVSTVAAVHGLSHAETLSTAWLTTLAALTGNDSIISGQAVSGRSEATAQTIGMLLHTVPIAADFAVETIAQTLTSVTTTTRLAHVAAAPSLTALARSMGRTTLFDTLIVVENYPLADPAELAPGLRIAQVTGEDDTHYPLSLTGEIAPSTTTAESPSGQQLAPAPHAVTIRLDFVDGLMGPAEGSAVLDAVIAVIRRLATAAPSDPPSMLLDAANAALGTRARSTSADTDRTSNPSHDQGAAGTAVTGATATGATATATGSAADAAADAEAIAALCETVAHALGIPVGSSDDFFALGGDSLTAITVVAGMRTRGWMLTPSAVFTHPRIDAMAAAVTRSDAEAAVAPETPSTPSVAIDSVGAAALGDLLAGIGGAIPGVGGSQSAPTTLTHARARPDDSDSASRENSHDPADASDATDAQRARLNESTT